MAVRAQGRDDRDQRLRSRHRQAGHPLHHPLPDAGLARGLRAGGGARGPRRQTGPLRAAVPARRHRHPGALPQGGAPHQDAGAHGRRGPLRLERRGQGGLGAGPGACRWPCPSGGCASCCRCWRAMGVAQEVQAARWKGVEPRPTRERIDKAAMVFEARRISDRRRLADLLKYMNTQRCRVEMLREYFGEPDRRAMRASVILAPASTARCSIPERPTSGTTCTRRPTFTPASGGASASEKPGRWSQRAGEAASAPAAATPAPRARRTAADHAHPRAAAAAGGDGGGAGRPRAKRPSIRTCCWRRRRRASPWPATWCWTPRRWPAGAAWSRRASWASPRKRRRRGRGRPTPEDEFAVLLGGGARRQHPALRRVAAQQAGLPAGAGQPGPGLPAGRAGAAGPPACRRRSGRTARATPGTAGAASGAGGGDGTGEPSNEPRGPRLPGVYNPGGD